MENLPSVRDRSTEEILTSQEVVRRKIMLTVHNVEREITNFRDRFLMDIEDIKLNVWLYIIDDICESAGRKQDKIEDFKDFENLLYSSTVQVSTAQSIEFNELKTLCDRARIFEYISFSLKSALVDAYDKYLKKFCLSFITETDDVNIAAAIREYEYSIIQSENIIVERIQLLDHLLDEHDSLMHPFQKYVDEYEKVIHLMMEVCHVFLSICDPIKKWTVLDAFYAKRLQSEINYSNKRKMDLKDIIKQTEYDYEQTVLKIKRQDFHIAKLEMQLSDTREDKYGLKRREIDILNHYDKIEMEIKKKMHNLQIIKKNIKGRKENSPSLYHHLVGQFETYRNDIKKLEKKQHITYAQVSSLKKDQVLVQKRIDLIAEKLAKCYKSRDMAIGKIAKLELDLKKMKKEAGNLDGMINGLKRVREIKLHSDTVKKIQAGYKHEEITAYKGRYLLKQLSIKSCLISFNKTR